MPGKIDLWQHPTTGRYYITWTVGTRSHRRSTRLKDHGQAQRVLAAFVLQQGGTEASPTADVAVETVLDSYYERHAQALPSAQRIAISIVHLKRFYGASAVSLVNARNNEKYIAKAREAGKADGTINRELGTLRAAVRFAYRSGDIAAAPFVPALAENNARERVLDHKQVDRLIEAARKLGHHHLVLFVQIAIATGARHRAILQLTWDRLDLKTGVVDFRLPGVAQTRKRRAVTVLPAGLLASLRHIQAEQASKPGDSVIQYSNARSDENEAPTFRSIKSIRRAFRQAATAAGLPGITPHILKHTAVSMALRVVSTWTVSGMTATSVRTLEKVYGKHMVRDLKAGAEAVARSGRVTRKSRAIRKARSAKKKAAKKRKE